MQMREFGLISKKNEFEAIEIPHLSGHRNPRSPPLQAIREVNSRQIKNLGVSFESERTLDESRCFGLILHFDS